jgi:hypothetical protein
MYLCRVFSIFIIGILAVSSVGSICSVQAQTIPQPSVPEFTIKITDHSYDIPPTYDIDQFTGQNITIQMGTHYQWKTLDFTIINQQDPSGYGLFYNIRYKGEYTTNWTELFHAGTYIAAQSEQYSIISFLLSGSYPSSIFGDVYRLIIPVRATVDFQVAALIGTTTRGSMQFGSGDMFNGESSNWSKTQTLTITDDSPTVNPRASSSLNSTATPQKSDIQSGVLFGANWEQIAIILLAITVVALAFVLVLSRRRSVNPN